MLEPLPPYSGSMTPCKKCGHFEARTVYYDEAIRVYVGDHTREGEEYHERTCERCGYIWYEAVLDGQA